MKFPIELIRHSDKKSRITESYAKFNKFNKNLFTKLISNFVFSMTQDTHLTGEIINFKTIKLIIHVSSFKNHKTETDKVVYIFL